MSYTIDKWAFFVIIKVALNHIGGLRNEGSKTND